MEMLDEMEELCQEIKDTALCGLGQTAPNPILSTLRYFRDEYEAHILEKRCPAHVCKNLLSYSIDPTKCRACSICARNCPAEAITGKPGKEVYKIDPAKCIKCGLCLTNCRFGAVERH
jgi:ferredoxin